MTPRADGSGRGLSAAAFWFLMSLAAPAAADPMSADRHILPPRDSAAAPPAPGDRRAMFRAIAARHAAAAGLPPDIADAVIRVESAYNPPARGAAGEVGLMQVMPPTARLLGFRGSLEELAEPETNIRLGVAYLAEAWRLGGKDICTATMKYRAGHRETRFSVLSVRYCVAVRTHLVSVGYPVTGTVPEPTFGFRTDQFRMGVAIGSVAAARRLHTGRKLKSRVAWKSYDARMKALDANAKRIGL